MSHKFEHLYDGKFRLFESEVSRTFPGAKPTEVTDLWAPPDGYNYVLADSGVFNACASRNAENGAVYTFFLGLHLSIVDAVCSIVCSEGFFNEIPFDLEVGEIDLTAVPARFIDYSFLLNSGNFLGPIAGKCFLGDSRQVDRSPRGRLGNHLMEVCLRFVSYHEQAHYLLGHVDMVSKNFGIQHLYEVQTPDANEMRINDYELSRLLEFHADGNAVGLLLGFRPGHERFDETETGLWLKSAKEPKMWAKCVLLSVATITSIISLAETKWLSDPAKRTHPHALSRLLFAMRTADQFLRDFIPAKKERDDFFASLQDDFNFVFKFLGVNFRFVHDASEEFPRCSDDSVNGELKHFDEAFSRVGSELRSPLEARS